MTIAASVDLDGAVSPHLSKQADAFGPAHDASAISGGD
jgi:hypothetical protein